MTAQQRDMVDRILRNAPFDLGGDVAVQRPLLEQMLTAQPLPADVRTTPGDLCGVPVVFIDIADVKPHGTIFHIHGGGFALGSAAGSVGLASALARKTGMRAVSVGYRLAPEHPYPAALQDVTAAYQALAGQAGGAGHIVVSGESAGGNLAVGLLVAGRAQGLMMPAAAVLFSPDDGSRGDRQQLHGQGRGRPEHQRRGHPQAGRRLPRRHRRGRPPGQPHLR